MQFFVDRNAYSKTLQSDSIVLYHVDQVLLQILEWHDFECNIITTALKLWTVYVYPSHTLSLSDLPPGLDQDKITNPRREEGWTWSLQRDV